MWNLNSPFTLANAPVLPLFLGLISPEGLSIDHYRRTMYWTDSGLDKIERAALDGSERKVLFHTDLVNPRAITVDPIRGLAGLLCSLISPVDLFWSPWLLYLAWEGLGRPG